MMTSSNGNIFCVTGPLCGEVIGHRWIPRTKASDAELWCFFFDLRLNKRLSKQSWGWWFEALLCSLWRHFNGHQWFRITIISRMTSFKMADENKRNLAALWALQIMLYLHCFHQNPAARPQGELEFHQYSYPRFSSFSFLSVKKKVRISAIPYVKLNFLFLHDIWTRISPKYHYMYKIVQGWV